MRSHILIIYVCCPIKTTVYFGQTIVVIRRGLGDATCLLMREIPTAGYSSSNEAKVAITKYIIRYYNQVRPHQYNGSLTPNESERRFNNEYKSVADFT